MKKIGLLLMFLVLALSLSSCSFFGLSPEQAKENLEAAGYTVRLVDSETYTNSDECTFALTSIELDYYLYAEKGEDKIYMFFFFDTDAASFNSSFINFSGLLSGQNNECVYYGTRQAIKDSKI